jgi:hypothetical protein
MKKRILSSLGIILYGIGIVNLLHNWFPNPGPGTMGTTPITILIAIIFGIANFFVLKKVVGKRNLLLYCSFLFIGFSIVAISLYPQEKPIKQVITAIDLWVNPSKIEYDDLFRLNYQEESVYVTAALAKFRDSIPEQAYTIRYCCEKPRKKFYIAKYGDKLLTNNKDLKINRKSGDTIQFEDEFHGELVSFSSPNDVFGKRKGWGTYIDLQTKRNSISFNKCKLEPIEGFNSIYYKMIK